MKLEYLYIDGYKGLKGLELRFKEQHSPVAVDFLVGKNGSGKSSVLEALGLIFTRIMQNELPGFAFALQYRMPDGVRVHVRPQKEHFRDETGTRRRLWVEIERGDERERLYAIPDEYLPDRLICCCSGTNGSMEEILLASPRASLASDLYDLSDQEEGEVRREAEEIFRYYERLETNPRAFFVDDVTSRFLLPVLFAVFPADVWDEREKETIWRYCGWREKLLKRLDTGIVPVAFSIRVDEEKLEQEPDTPQLNILRRLIGEEDRINDDTVHRLAVERAKEGGEAPSEVLAVFLYQKWEDVQAGWYHPRLQEYVAGNPFLLLSALLGAYREGVIRSVHFFYCFGKKNGGYERGIHEIEALSDGELMWISRIGLALMAQAHCGDNTLFLYDEPDVHFNDDWNRDFIQCLYEICGERGHEFLIATHSTLMLTDAMYEQVYLLENLPGGRTKMEEVNISTFAAGRDEISRQVFQAESIGAFAEGFVQERIRTNDPEKIEETIGKMGPGYRRFCMYEQLYSLLEAKEEG